MEYDKVNIYFNYYSKTTVTEAYFFVLLMFISYCPEFILWMSKIIYPHTCIKGKKVSCYFNDLPYGFSTDIINMGLKRVTLGFNKFNKFMNFTYMYILNLANLIAFGKKINIYINTKNPLVYF